MAVRRYAAEFDIDVDALHAQLTRLFTVRHLPGVDDLIATVLGVLKPAEALRGRCRIRQPGSADASAYAWRRQVPSPSAAAAAPSPPSTPPATPSPAHAAAAAGPLSPQLPPSSAPSDGRCGTPSTDATTTDSLGEASEDAPFIDSTATPAADPCALLMRAIDESANDRIMQAKDLVELAALHAGALPTTSMEYQAYAAALRERRYAVEEIARKHAGAARLVEECGTGKQWRQIGKSNGVDAYYRNDGGGWHASRFEAVVGAPAFHVIALLREIDLWTRWMPSILGFGCHAAHIADSPFRTTIQAASEVRLPWPLANRDFAIDIECVDSLGCPARNVILLFKDTTHPAPKQPGRGVVRMNIEDSGCIVTPYYERDPYQTHVTFLLCIDVKMDVLPEWVVRAVFGTLAGMIVEQIRTAVAVVRGDAWAARFGHPRSPFYGWLRGMITREIPEQAASLPQPGCPAEHRHTPLSGVDKYLMAATVGRAAVCAALAAAAVVAPAPDPSPS